jgi:hypothetical protein
MVKAPEMQPTHIGGELLECRIANLLLPVSPLGMIVMASSGTGNSLFKIKCLELSRKHPLVFNPISSYVCFLIKQNFRKRAMGM